MALDLNVYDEINRLAEILNIERFTNNEIAALFKYFDDDENLSIVKKALIKSKNDEVKLAYLRNVLASGTGKLRKLPKPERWGSRDYCLATFGEPDFILFRADNEDKLESINDTEVVVTVEVKPEQLMVDLVEGTEITADGQFEKVSSNASKFDSPLSPQKSDHDNDDDNHPDSDHSDNSDQSDNERQKTEPKKEPNTRPKITTRDAKKVNMKNFKHTSDDKFLIGMKNYDCERFYFGETLGFGRSGTVVKAKLCGKSGALKIVDLYNDDVKLKEMLNEIKIYRIIFKKIQGIYVPKLLKFGVLHEAFVFMLTSFAGESFASKRNSITKEEKLLAIKGLQKIHALGVKHGDIRLDNIMMNRLMDRSHVWWIDFALSEIIGNAEDLEAELFELRYLLDL
ncbi:hypothetical protein RhiirA4_427430 [Rhizophagus irregularis]|uniref:Protein kinase domain-containing protein n=1 Tax=Rhizophagus irregularis TaxID=588596 RepID=A0A2I1H900_9GLOM|nr:hypothetical protein RhiirA4_427430 [Rhizophagus irregularis]